MRRGSLSASNVSAGTASGLGNTKCLPSQSFERPELCMSLADGQAEAISDRENNNTWRHGNKR